MVIARIERKPERLCVGDEFQEVSDVVQKWTENFETSQGYASQNGTPLRQGVRMPQQILAGKASKSSRAMRTFPSLQWSITELMLVKWL